MKHYLSLFSLCAIGGVLLTPSFAHAEPAATSTSPLSVEGRNPVLPDVENTIEFKAAADTTQMRVLTLHSVKPSLMAWWLDPQRAPLPDDVKNSLFAGMKGDPLAGFRPEMAHLPTDIAKLKIVDAQRQLTAYGTPQALTELESIIDALDALPQQVEFEVRGIRLAKKDVRSLRLWPYVKFHGNQSAGDAQPTFGLISPDTLKQLESLIASNRAKVVMAPRLTVTSGLTASLFSETAMPALLVGALPNGKPDTDIKKARTAYIQTYHGITLHPIVRPDGSVLVSCDLELGKLNGHIVEAEMREREVGIFGFLPLKVTQPSSL